MTHASNGTTVAAFFVALLAGCEGAMAARGSSGRDAGAAADAAMRGADPPPPWRDLGPLPPDPSLDGVDRTRAASCPASASWVVAVRARIVAESGAPIAGAYLQTCIQIGGSDRRVCLRPSMTDARGVVTALVPEESRCVGELALRALLPDTTRATSYCAVLDAPVDGVVSASRPIVLVDTVRPRSRPPAGEPTSMRDVVFDGVTLSTSPNAIGADAYEMLSARVTPGLFAAEACLGDGSSMDALVAFAPEAHVELASGLPARIEGHGFAPGERVDLFVLGGLAVELAGGVEVREGHWHRFGTVTVARDGTLSTSAGQGVPYLGWLGLRRAR